MMEDEELPDYFFIDDMGYYQVGEDSDELFGWARQ